MRIRSEKQEHGTIKVLSFLIAVDAIWTSLVSSPNSKDFDEFLERIRETDVLQWAINQRPDSAWVCEILTIVTFFINRIIDHPIGCVQANPLPVYIKKKKSVIGLEMEPNHNKRYNDNLCLFRCLALHRGCDLYRLEPAVKTLYEAYDRDNVPMEEFATVTLDDLYRTETTFQTNVCVYKLVKQEAEDGKSTAELVRRSLCKYPETMYLNLHIFPLSKMYACTATRIDVGSAVTHYGIKNLRCAGMSACVPLEDENIRFAESLRYYPYRATFDFECWFDTEQLPSDSDKVHWVARHVPLSVSVASNVPRHEQVQCLVTDGDTDKLVSAMMDILRAMNAPHTTRSKTHTGMCWNNSQRH